MRVSDIIKKLSKPSSQTFWSKANNDWSKANNKIKTRESASSSSSDEPIVVNEIEETALLKTVPLKEAEKIQRTSEGVITMPLSDGNPMDSGYVLYKKFPIQLGGVVMGKYRDDDKSDKFERMWATLNDFLVQLMDNKRPSPSIVISMSEEIINSLVQNDALVKILYIEKNTNDITSNLIDVAIVSTKIGLRLDYSDSQMKELVTCALMHDIGMLRVAGEIVLKKEKLEETELEEIRRHPLYSYEMLKNNGFSPVVSEIAYQEQEREDGSGYPRGLKGESIHEYAKIIGLSAIYTAMLQPRPQRERKFPFQIIKEIIDKNKKQFPLHLIRILIDELSVFPVGLYVKLNTGDIGRVVRTNRLAPMRPVIEIVRDSHHREPQEHREYDLMKEHILAIKDTLFEII